MAINKSNEFPPKDQRIAAFAKALAHPARVAILKAIAKRGVCICGEIVEVLPLAQSTVSQHLKDLKEAGILSGTIEGTKSCYCIDWDALQEGWDALQGMVKEMETSKRKCC